MFLLYSNPTANQITVELNTINNESNATLIDMYGKEVLSQKLYENISTINIANIPSGIYNIRIKGNQKTWYHKIVIIN